MRHRPRALPDAGVSEFWTLRSPWAVFAAPRSSRRLADPALFAFQLLVFLVGAGLLALADQPVWGAALAVVATVVVVLDRVLGRAASR